MEDKVTELGEPFSESALAKAESEVRQGFRVVKVPSFKDKGEMEVKIEFPSVGIDAEASRIYDEALTDGLTSEKKILTRDEMEEALKERGVWSDAKDSEIESIDDRMANLMREGQTMHSGKKVNKKRLEQLKQEFNKLKEEKDKLVAKKQSFASSTIEGLAELAALQYKLFRCTYDKDGNRLWEDFEDFKKEHNRTALATLLQEAMVFWSGLPQGILSALPNELTIGEQISEQSLESQSGA